MGRVWEYETGRFFVGRRRSPTAVILDEYQLWAEAVECVLRRTGIEVVGKATSSAAALELIRRARPDLLVTDIGAADGQSAGLTCLRDALQHVPDLRGIVLSHGEKAWESGAALQAGAVAHVLKSAHPDDLASAVRKVFAHSVHSFSNEQTPDDVTSPDRTVLTNRELEILRLLAEGYSNAQLARMLWVTERTVKFHLTNIYRKLHVVNRTEAARWAQLHGLVASSDSVAAA